MMLRRGIPLEFVRDILGHTSIKTTEIYAKIERVALREQMKKMSGK